MSVRDSQRRKVYAAEEFVRTLFDRAARHHSRSLDFFGAAITLPPEARFGSVDAVQRYVDQVLALPTVTRRWPGVDAVAVRPRRAATAAHNESAGVIAVPATAQWALRELVVLHEVAHHLADSAGGDGPPHGPVFSATFCELLTLVMGPEAGHVLRVVYAKEGVR